MEIELERTFLVKSLPKDFEKSNYAEIIDIYIPENEEHPVLRIRKRKDIFEITKKTILRGKDSSVQTEQTISLSENEFLKLSKIKGKRLRKIRYYFNFKNRVAEIDVYKDDLEGLVMVDFEFNLEKEKEEFQMPEFCLAEVTQEKHTAAGMMAGKKYSEISNLLSKYSYKKII